MVFADLLFVFIFFTAASLSQVILPGARNKNIALLIFSLAFYTWAGVRFLIVLLAMVFVAKIGAVYIEKARLNGKNGKEELTDTVCLLLLTLFTFKYAGFFASVWGDDSLLIALPLGISFYTFQLISYIVDVYRGETEAQKNYWMLLLYTSLFHQCIAGPIVRYKDVYGDLLERKITLNETSKGLSRFITGLAKKTIIANGCAEICDPILNGSAEHLAEVSAFAVFLGLALYLAQYYFDFSAYSDMAIGMGLMCGLHYKENFNYPFMSKSVTDLWKRWHISLGTFFRDYVYIPLGGNRGSFWQNIATLFAVWGLTGFWHGAGWNYIIWGLYFFVLIIIGRYIVKDRLNFLPSIFKIIGIFSLLTFSMFFMRYTDFHLLFIAMKSLFTLNGNAIFTAQDALLLKNNAYFLTACVVFSTPYGNAPRVFLENKAKKNIVCKIIYAIVEIAVLVTLLLLSACALAGNSYNPFLYFQF